MKVLKIEAIVLAILWLVPMVLKRASGRFHYLMECTGAGGVVRNVRRVLSFLIVLAGAYIIYFVQKTPFFSGAGILQFVILAVVIILILIFLRKTFDWGTNPM